MNCSIPDTPHLFCLAGMKVGDWFLGCPKCFHQYPTNAAGAVYCHCGTRKLLYDIKPHNAAEVAAHNRAAIVLAENRSEYS